MKLKDFRLWGLLPSHLIMLLTLIIPMGIIVLVSFSTRGPYGGFEFEFSVAPYVRLLFIEGWSGEVEFNPQYLEIIGRTILLASLTTLICMTLSFPVAYLISRQSQEWKAILIYLVTLPFWVSMIVRVYAWLIILGNDGPAEISLSFFGLIDGNTSLLFNSGAMLAGMVYSYIPLMILPVFASIEKLDGALIEAAHDLYGGRWKTLVRVILPLSWPGLAAGGILVFVPSLGTVLEPVLLGGGKSMMMGNLIENQFGSARNWPFGAAIAIVLMALVMIVLMVNGMRARRRSQTEEV